MLDMLLPLSLCYMMFLEEKSWNFNEGPAIEYRRGAPLTSFSSYSAIITIEIKLLLCLLLILVDR